MNVFDYVLLGIVVGFTLIGLLRGFVREMLSLALWPLAAVVAWIFANDVAAYLTFLANSTVRRVAGFSIIFIVVFVIGALLIGLILRKLSPSGALQVPNMLLGGIVGAARAGVIVTIVFLVAGITPLPQRSWWTQSLLAPYFEHAARTVSEYLPEHVARDIGYG